MTSGPGDREHDSSIPPHMYLMLFLIGLPGSTFSA
jgi:hypothetical protein